MNAVRRLILVSSAAALLAAAGPAWSFSFVVGGSGPQVNGSGTMVDETRSVGGFNGVVLTGAVDVILKAGATERVTVHADDNIAPLIETKVVDGKLQVGTVPGASFRTRNRLYATVEYRELASVNIRGSGDVKADRIKSPIFEATIRGSGDVIIEALESEAVAISISGSGDFSTAGGRADKLGVVIVGSGDVRVDKLASREAAVRIRGSGDVRVHATEALQVDIAGSGDVVYRGEPRISKRVAGSGEVRPMR